jgi:hypothetical protein
MINELLEKREILGEIAAELYGDLWITNDNFWGSQTEQDLFEVNEQLQDLGWIEDVSDEEEAFADKLIELLIQEGKLKRDEE